MVSNDFCNLCALGLLSSRMPVFSAASVVIMLDFLLSHYLGLGLGFRVYRRKESRDARHLCAVLWGSVLGQLGPVQGRTGL